MQEPEEEALKAKLYYEIIKLHTEQGKQKKSRIAFVVLAAIWATIAGPLILFLIEKIFTSQKWPLVIQIPDLATAQYELVTGVCTVIFIFWALWRLFHPFRCHCGYFTWSAKSMLTHVEMKHGEWEYNEKNEKNERMVWRIIYHIFHHPFRCQCGYYTWAKWKMLLHLEIHHGNKT